MSYAIVAREELSRDKRRMIRLDIFMGPVTWQILDQAGYTSALEILRRAQPPLTKTLAPDTFPLALLAHEEM